VSGASVSGDHEELGTVEAPLAQRLAEELVVDLVRQNVDVIGLLELERDVIAALGGTALDRQGHPTPMAMLASVLVDQAFRRVEVEWRESRVLAAGSECVCCVMEQQAAQQRKKGKAS
jgi:hypothetical protein